MAATHAGGTFSFTSTTLVPGTPQTSTTNYNNDAGYGFGITAQCTPAGTLTTAATCTIKISEDGGTSWRSFSSQTSGLVSGTLYEFLFDMPHWVRLAQVIFSANVGANCTIGAQYQATTGL